ncbi:hypothetical protein [Nocardia callitridis]|uniref:hypothetical protein n=1 Tax=Nocardia callitridis TaxID=648753 RepID=UPI0031F1B244
MLDSARPRVGHCGDLRWLPTQPGTCAANTLFDNARADWVLCLRPGTDLNDSALDRLGEFITAHPDCRDLLQGPMSCGPQARDVTQLEPVWHRGIFGVPGRDPRSDRLSGAPFEIGMQDLGVFACRKDCWPGIDPRLGMSTGPAGYLHKLFRARARRTLCLPFLRWSYTPDHDHSAFGWEADLLFTYLLCWEHAGYATEPIIEHYLEGRGPEWVDHHVAHWQSSRNNPFDAFDALVCINADQQPQRWTRMAARFAELGIADRVQRLPAVATPWRYQLGCALSHRRAIAMAQRRGLDSILVFEDDAVFLRGTKWVLRRSVEELMGVPWKLFYLGGFYNTHPIGGDAPVSGASFLRHASGMVTTHAVAYHREVFEQILADLPEEPEAMHDFLAPYHGHIDHYYAEIFDEGVYRCTPSIASQESMVRLEHAHLRDQFEIDL